MTYYDTCPYCDTQYRVEFENEDDETFHCPSCGEEVPDLYEEDEIEFDEDDED